MAKIYNPPEEVGPPPSYVLIEDFKEYEKATEEWVKSIQELARKNGTNPLLGEIYRTPVADGYAQYVVWSTRPLALVHLPIYDAWYAPEALERGLRLSDIKQYIDFQKMWKSKR